MRVRVSMKTLHDEHFDMLRSMYICYALCSAYIPRKVVSSIDKVLRVSSRVGVVAHRPCLGIVVGTARK